MCLGSKRSLPGLDAELLMNRNLITLDYYKYLKRLRSESTRNAFFDLKQLDHSSRLAQPGILSLEQFCNGFDSDTKPDVFIIIMNLPGV